MNLLICTSEYYPNGSGIANVAFNIVEQLKKKGVNCTVCSPTGPDIKKGSTRLIKKLGIIGLIYFWYQVSINFKKSSYDVVWLHNPLFIKKSQFDRSVVLLHSTYYGKKVAKSKPLFYNTLASNIEKFCLHNLGDDVIFTSVGNGIKDELKSLGLNCNVIHVPNGVDTCKFKPMPNKYILRDKFGLNKEDIIFLSVGRLIELKKPLESLILFKHLLSRLDHVALVFAGDGSLLQSLREYAINNKINKVHFLGKVDKDLPELYACCDYFITASDYEGGEPTLTIAEAISSGLPCITSNIPTFKIVETKNIGINIDFRNADIATRKVIDYLQLDYSVLSASSRKYAEDKLDWTKISDVYFQIFRSRMCGDCVL